MINFPVKQSELSVKALSLAMVYKTIIDNISTVGQHSLMVEWEEGLTELVGGVVAGDHNVFANPDLDTVSCITNYLKKTDLKDLRLKQTRIPFYQTQINECKLLGYTDEDIAKITAFHDIKYVYDLFTKPNINYVYMKLETGGLAGYITDLNTQGAYYYPILRVSWAINDSKVYDVVIKPEKKSMDSLSNFVRRMHTESGLLDLVEKSTINEEAAIAMILESFKEHNVGPSVVQSNQLTVLVANGTDFIRSFLHQQMPRINSYFYGRMIDMQVSNTKAIMEGNHYKEFIPNIYTTPEAFIPALRAHHLDN